MRKISLIQASMLYKVTNRTVQRWIAEDNINCKNGTYDLDKLQAAYDKRQKPKPRLRFK